MVKTPPPNPHQQRSQAHSADSPHGEGEQDHVRGKIFDVFQRQYHLHRLVLCYLCRVGLNQVVDSEIYPHPNPPPQAMEGANTGLWVIRCTFSAEMRCPPFSAVFVEYTL